MKTLFYIYTYKLQYLKNLLYHFNKAFSKHAPLACHLAYLGLNENNPLPSLKATSHNDTLLRDSQSGVIILR